MAVESVKVQVLEKLWDWAKDLRLEPEGLRNEVWLSKHKYGQTSWHMAAERRDVNPLKPELNPICYLLALLGAHHSLHVSRIRVKLLTFRLLMS